MQHELKREDEGVGMMSSITPTCSCGWRGRKEYAYEDWQLTNVADQERAHLRDVGKSEQQRAQTD